MNRIGKNLLIPKFCPNISKMRMTTAVDKVKHIEIMLRVKDYVDRRFFM